MATLSPPRDRTQRLSGVDALRGVAAMSVCLCHFTVGSPTFLSDASWIKQVGAFGGTYGVHVFFVISGFIIPFSLARAHYRLADAPRYILRRIARIDPPYLVSLMVALLIALVLDRLPNSHAPPFPRWYHILGHVGYLNGLLGWPWAVSVYWTLAIEFQYYLCVALCFPLLFSSSKWVSTATILVWSTAGFFLPAWTLVFRFGSLFATGFILCRYVEGRNSGRETLVLLALDSACLWQVFGWPAVPVALLTALGICRWTNPSREWLFLGKISYSLYLIHPLIGFHIINGFVKYRVVNQAGPLAAWLVILFAYVVTILVAWAYWSLVEWPSHRWAQRLSAAAAAVPIPPASETTSTPAVPPPRTQS